MAHRIVRIPKEFKCSQKCLALKFTFELSLTRHITHIDNLNISPCGVCALQ